MQYPSWASARNNISYRRRTPEQSALYRLAYHYRDELERRWDELFAKKYGCLRPEVLEAFDKYLNCGILRFGTARAYCDSCKHSVLVAFSCKRRGVCDSCAAKRAVLFAENLHTNVLLHYPHRHLVFSLPKRLRVYFHYDRSLLSGLYKAAWESVKESFALEFPEGNAGGVFSLHTSGALPSWHPHLHCIVLDGVIEAGEFRESKGLDPEIVESCFSKKVLKYLESTGLIESEVSASILGQTNTGFSVYVGDAVSENI